MCKECRELRRRPGRNDTREEQHQGGMTPGRNDTREEWLKSCTYMTVYAIPSSALVPALSVLPQLHPAFSTIAAALCNSRQFLIPHCLLRWLKCMQLVHARPSMSCSRLVMYLLWSLSLSPLLLLFPRVLYRTSTTTRCTQGRTTWTWWASSSCGITKQRLMDGGQKLQRRSMELGGSCFIQA